MNRLEQLGRMHHPIQGLDLRIPQEPTDPNARRPKVNREHNAGLHDVKIFVERHCIGSVSGDTAALYYQETNTAQKLKEEEEIRIEAQRKALQRLQEAKRHQQREAERLSQGKQAMAKRKEELQKFLENLRAMQAQERERLALRSQPKAETPESETPSQAWGGRGLREGVFSLGGADMMVVDVEGGRSSLKGGKSEVQGVKRNLGQTAFAAAAGTSKLSLIEGDGAGGRESEPGGGPEVTAPKLPAELARRLQLEERKTLQAFQALTEMQEEAIKPFLRPKSTTALQLSTLIAQRQAQKEQLQLHAHSSLGAAQQSPGKKGRSTASTKAAAEATTAPPVAVSMEAPGPSKGLSDPLIKRAKAKAPSLPFKLPRLCPCGHDADIFDPKYIDHCGSNCALYKNPAEHERHLRMMLAGLGLLD